MVTTFMGLGFLLASPSLNLFYTNAIYMYNMVCCFMASKIREVIKAPGG